LNNYTEQEEKDFQSLPSSPEWGLRYIIYGRETGENGTPHLQGYLHFQHKKSLRQLKNFNGRAHWETSQGSPEQNKDYCSKQGDVFESGDLPLSRSANAASLAEKRKEKNQKILNQSLKDLVDSGEISIQQLPLLKKAKLVYLQEEQAIGTDSVRGVWIYGQPGTGKSHYARQTYGDSLYIKAQNKWFDGYSGEKAILLDDLDTGVLGHHLKIWMDKYACTGEIKGGMVNLRHTKFVVTSNYKPEDLFEDAVMAAAIRRRCEFKHFAVVYRDSNE
jgi:hypothetical protein